MTSAVFTDAIDAKLLLSTLEAFKEGDFSVRLPIDGTGLEGKIYDTLNGIFQLTHRLTNELVWISATVGREGESARIAGSGFWRVGELRRLNKPANRRSRAAVNRGRPRHRRCGQRRPV